MIDKIKEYLKSTDQDIVLLGATMLETHVSQEDWLPILEESFGTAPKQSEAIQKMADEINEIMIWGSASPKRPTYSIKDGKIHLTFPSKGLWEQLNKDRNYTIYTGRGGKNLIEQAFKKEIFKK